ncbi:MAG: hypothetical protein AABM30_00525 [Actinomycetota bacterium]
MRGWWKVPFAGLVVLTVIVSAVGANNRRARSYEWCGLDSSTPRMEQIRDVKVDWTWRPPGFDCVFTDDRGHEVARRRASPP